MDMPFKFRESTVFFSFTRLVIVGSDPNDQIVFIRMLRSVNINSGEQNVSQKFVLNPDNSGVLEAMIDRTDFPDAYNLEILSKNGLCTLSCRGLVDLEQREYQRSSLDDFLAAIADWRQRHPGATPKVLDIGGRARSGHLLADRLGGCAVTVLDIIADSGVHVVADIHDMSEAFGAERFDFLICVSVFEHLVMPWKAVIEINKVMSDDAIAMILTHQTVGMHDLPWDYFRFSDQSWKGLFNAATGFEIVKTMMDNFVRITPMRYFNVEPGGENAGGFYESSVMVRKIGSTDLQWPVSRAAIVETNYPA